MCGKRGGAETRPGRGEDGPAGQNDRGPGGRRAAQRSHVPPWIRRQPGPGLPSCPPGGSSGWGPGGTGDSDNPVLERWPPQAHPSARASQRGWRSELRGLPLEDSGPSGGCSAPGSRRGQRPGQALPAHGLKKRGEGKGSRRAGLAGALPWHSSAPGSGAGGARASSFHRRGEGSPAGCGRR